MNMITKWLKKYRQRASRRRPVSSPDAALNRPLLWFGKHDVWTIRDALQGLSAMGSTGSGKTTGTGQTVATSYLTADFGGLGCCAKGSETGLWRQYGRETNRSDSLMLFGPTHPYRFNFLDYEFRRPGAGAGLTENLVRLFSTVMEVAQRQRGQGGANQDFWERTTKQLLRNAIDLVAIARGRLLLQEIYDVITTAPATLEEVNSTSWRNSSLCWRCIREGQARPKNPLQAHDFEHAVKYWTREFPGLSDRTRSIIVTSLTSLMDIFLRGILRELFCTTTNIMPEMTFEGAVIILDLPVKEFGEVGQLAQVLFKYIWQRACERRDVTRHPRPVFLWCDEAQFFATARDTDFQSTARSSRVATVYMTQNIGGYYAQLGQSETHSLLGNLQTKIFHANGDPQTNNWAADLFSRSYQHRGSTSIGTGRENTVSRNFSSSESIDLQVQPAEFTSLAKGGPENNWSVEAIAFQGGRIWNGSRKIYTKVRFAQR